MAKFYLEFSSSEQFDHGNHSVYPLSARNAQGAVREAMDAAPILVDRFAAEYEYWYESDPDASVFCRVIDDEDDDLGARWILRVAPPGDNSDDFSE